MAIPSIRRLSRIAVVIVVIAMLALPVVFPEATQAIGTAIAARIGALPTHSIMAIVVEIAVGAALVVVVAIWWLWWRLPTRQVTRLAIQISDPKARADTEDNFRKTIGQALGGAAVLIGAGFGLFQFLQQQKTASEQQRTAAEQFAQQQKASAEQFAQQQKTASDQALAQQKAAQDLLISNQVSKGFEQLASDKLAMRLGGIYALEGVMNTSGQYHQPVLEALCAFVRDSTRDQNGKGPPATDIQAVLTVIGRRASGAGAGESLNLRNARIPKAGLFSVNLTHADLRGANLTGADLTGANLFSANLTDAYLAVAHLRGAYLPGAVLTDAVLAGADLTDADLGSAHLDPATNLTGTDLAATNLSGANLSNARLTQAQLDLACGKPKALPKDRILDKPCPEKPASAPNQETP